MKGLVALMTTVVVLVAVSSANGAKPPPSNWSVKPTKLNFGREPAGQTSSALAVTITNTSSVTEQVPGGFQTVSGDFGVFNVEGGSSCLNPAPPVSLLAGGSCTFLIDFHPPTTGTFSATIQLDLSPGPPALVTVSGRGT